MADTKISNMTAAGTLTGAELVPLVQGGNNVKSTTAAIAALAPASMLLEGAGTTAKKWSQLNDANLHLGGTEIFALGILGDQSYQIAFSELCSEVAGFCFNEDTTFEVVEFSTSAGGIFQMPDDGSIELAATGGAYLNINADGSFLLVGGGNASLITDDSGGFTMNSGDGSVSMNSSNGGTVNLINNFTGDFIEVTSSGAEISAATFVMNGQTGYTGTVASAAGRNIINGIIY